MAADLPFSSTNNKWGAQLKHLDALATPLAGGVATTEWTSFFRKTVLYLLFSNVFPGSLLFIIVNKSELVCFEKGLKARLLNSVIVSLTAVCQVSNFKTENLNDVLLEPFSSMPIYCRPKGRCKATCVTQQINVS